VLTSTGFQPLFFKTSGFLADAEFLKRAPALSKSLQSLR
jgi:hypothetical protein